MDAVSCVARPAGLLSCLLVLSFSTCLGDDASFRSSVLLGPRSHGGMYRYYPGRWNAVHVRLTNRLDREALLLSTAYAGDDASVQSARAQWLPPQSMIDVSYPVWIPVPPQGGAESCELHMQLFESVNNQEQLVPDATGKLISSASLLLSNPTASTGLIGPAHADPMEVKAIQQLYRLSREHNQLPTMIHEMPDSILPAPAEAYSQLDELIVADDRVCDDEAVLEGLREWLSAGGHMWIMMDQMSPTTINRLLGDACDVVEIDRVGLNSFTLTQRTFEGDVDFANGEFEQPIPFVRISSARGKVEYRIDDWPAAFWLDYGAGRILITTLGARGWLPPQYDSQPIPVEPEPQPPVRSGRGNRGNRGSPQQSSKPLPIEPARKLTSTFFAPRPKIETPPANLPHVVEGYIGYSIPERRWIVGLLGGFAAALFIAIAALWYLRRLEWIGIVTPGLGLAFGAILVLTGFRHQHAVGATVGQLQIAEPVAGGEKLRLNGLAGLYFPDSLPAPIAGQQGGRLAPDMTGLSSMNRRLVWTDFNQWHWENLQQPRGLRLAEYSASARLETPLNIHATLGPEGIRGQLTQGLPAIPEDAVLLTSSGRLGVKLDAAGNFAATPNGVLGVGQNLAADVLSDAQRRRSEVLETLLGGTTRGKFPRQPSLACWTPPIDGGLRFAEGLQELGEALVLVPIEFRRPAPGVDMLIPSPLIQIREGIGPDRSVPVGLIDSRSGEWQERSGSVATWLRLQLPPELAPFEPQSLDVVIRVSGNLGQLKLAGWKDGKPHPLQAWEAPVGVLRASIPDASSLPVGADGSLPVVGQGRRKTTGIGEEIIR